MVERAALLRSTRAASAGRGVVPFAARPSPQPSTDVTRWAMEQFQELEAVVRAMQASLAAIEGRLDAIEGRLDVIEADTWG